MAGIALGTALGAWTNVGILIWLGRSRDLLAIEKIFLQCPAGLAAGGAGLRRGRLDGREPAARPHGDVVALAAAILRAGMGYGAVLLLFRDRLPSGAWRDAMRLFVALSIPDAVAQSLMLLQGGVPGARWQAREQLHLTLRFIGEVDGRDARALDDALAAIDAPAFELQLHGVGQFGNKQPHTLWAAARKNDLLDHLQRKVDTAIRRVGQPQDAHKFNPHVTLARLRHPELEQVRQWLTASCALYQRPNSRLARFIFIPAS